jgi:hypothetical protein
MNVTRNAVLYVVMLIAVIGWVAFGVQACKTQDVSEQLTEAVRPELEREGYVEAEVTRVTPRQPLPPGVRTVAVAEGSVRYPPIQESEGPRPSDLPGTCTPTGTETPPPSSEIGAGADALDTSGCNLDALQVDVRCRLELVDVADQTWFGRLLVSGTIRTQDGRVRTLSEHVAEDLRFRVAPDIAPTGGPKWWGAVRAGVSTAPSAIIGGSLGRGRFGGWAQADIREAGTEYAGGLEIRW